MKRTLFLFAIALFMFWTPSAVAQETSTGDSGRDFVVEQRIYDRLRQISPEAVPLFRQATEAMDSDQLTRAKELYEQVLALAPGFPDALRRLSYVDAALGNIDDAVTHARAAVAADPSPFNQSALARALLATDDPSVTEEALNLAQKAADALPDDIDTQTILALAAAANGEVELIRQTADRLIELDPDYPFGHFLSGLVEADRFHWVVAERQLLQARDLGMPAEMVDDVLDMGVRTWATAVRWERRLVGAIAVWLIGLVVLALSGLVLSRLTLKAVQRALKAGPTQPTSGERTVRMIYRVVVVLTSIYFYISIPFVVLVILEIVGAIFFGFYALGWLPVRVAGIILIFAVVTLIAVVRSLFTRIKEGEPGRVLTPQEAPQLWQLTKNVAKHLETRPVDAIFIRPGTEIGVTERGGMWKKMRGKGDRCLILGLGALPGLRLRQFEAILAHEYAHLFNRDTAGGGLAVQVQASMHHMAFRLAKGGQAAPFNPAWLFVAGFYRIYLRVTLGASRLQEILADRAAATAYGAQAFISGLTHIVRQSLVFQTQVDVEVSDASKVHRPLHNLYALPPVSADRDGKTIDDLLEQAISRPTSQYDSHPATIDRIHFVEKIGTPEESQDPGAPVWTLLPHREALQLEMTTAVQKNVEQFHGLSFSP